MFSEKDRLKLEFVLQMISEAEEVVKRHGSAYDAVLDTEGRNAILLNLLQIGEKLNKIESDELRAKLPVKESYSVRNRITHDYGGIDLEIIESIIIYEFPEFKKTISGLLK